MGVAPESGVLGHRGRWSGVGRRPLDSWTRSNRTVGGSSLGRSVSSDSSSAHCSRRAGWNSDGRSIARRAQHDDASASTVVGLPRRYLLPPLSSVTSAGSPKTFLGTVKKSWTEYAASSNARQTPNWFVRQHSDYLLFALCPTALNVVHREERPRPILPIDLMNQRKDQGVGLLLDTPQVGHEVVAIVP